MHAIRRIVGSFLHGRSHQGPPRAPAARLLLGAVLLPLALVIHPPGAAAASAETARIIDPAGCSMAHCDRRCPTTRACSGPSGAVGPLWHDTSVLGSVTGLGCSTNTKVVACSLYNDLFHWNTVKVYTPSGAKVWSSSRCSTAPRTSRRRWWTPPAA